MGIHCINIDNIFTMYTCFRLICVINQPKNAPGPLCFIVHYPPSKIGILNVRIKKNQTVEMCNFLKVTAEALHPTHPQEQGTFEPPRG